MHYTDIHSFPLNPPTTIHPTYLYLQHYQKDSDGLICRLKHSVKKTSGNIEYTVSLQDFTESKFHAVTAYANCISTMIMLMLVP